MELQKLKQRLPKPLRPYIDQLERSPLGKRLAKGMFWSLLGTVFSRGLALISTIIVARILGKETFGELSIIQSTLIMFVTYATFSMGLTANKHIAEYKTSAPERAGRIAVLSSLVATLTGSAVAILMITTAPLIATHLLSAPDLAGYIRLGGVALTFNVVNAAQLGTLSGLEAFKRRAHIEVIVTGCVLPVSVTAAYFFGLTGAVASLIFLNVLRVSLNTYGIRKEAQLARIPLVWSKLHSEIGILWRFSFPAILAGGVYVPAIWAANVLLVNAPNGYSEMGLFGVADRWRTAIMVFPGMLGGVILPILSSLHGEGRADEYKRMVWRNVKIALGISLSVAGPIALLSPWIMAAYGSEFKDGRQVLVVLCAVATVQATYWIMGQSFISRGKLWTNFRLNVVWATTLLTSTWLMQHRGAFGLATAYLLADSIRLILGFIACHRYLHPNPIQSNPIAVVPE